MDILKKTIAFLASFKLATALLLLLLLLTFFGTLEQGRATLIDVQETYFASPIVFHEVGPGVAQGIRGALILFGLLTLAVAFYLTVRDKRSTTWTTNLWWTGGILTGLGLALLLATLAGSPTVIPLPGAMVLLPLLLLNLLIGGMIRMRTGKSTIGVFIVHIGIVVLFLGSWVEHQWKTDGYLKLFEGQHSNEFVSYTDWEVVIAEQQPGGTMREVVIPHERFAALRGDAEARFEHSDLPFAIVLSGYEQNAKPKKVAEGYVLESKKPVDAKNSDRMRNLAGMYATVIPQSGDAQRDILWSGQQLPWTIEEDGRMFQIDLRPRRWKLPFDVQLDDFVHEVHPGTGMARRYSSFITQIDQRGIAREIHITMNEPLRSEGYTLFQSGWGPPNARPGAPLYSTFSVVRNPSDQVPLIACVIIAVGLLIHFIRKLVFFLQAQSRRNAAEAKASA